MKMGEKGLKLVKSFEGLYLKAYKCPAGVWTIGYGHTGKVNGKAIRSGKLYLSLFRWKHIHISHRKNFV